MARIDKCNCQTVKLGACHWKHAQFNGSSHWTVKTTYCTYIFESNPFFYSMLLQACLRLKHLPLEIQKDRFSFKLAVVTEKCQHCVKFSALATTESQMRDQQCCPLCTKQEISEFAFNSMVAVRMHFFTVQRDTAPSSCLILLLKGNISLEGIWANPALFYKTCKEAGNSSCEVVIIIISLM